MKNKMIYAFALALAATTLGSVSSLKAEINRTKAVIIPFQFQVDKKTMPSGEYCVEQEAGTEVATLVNTKTGARVRVLRPAARRKEGKTVLTFVPGKNGVSLKVS
jgi:hypothetical protein